MPQIDVLIITALEEEYKATYEMATATCVKGYGISRWDEYQKDSEYPYVIGTYVIPDKPSLVIALVYLDRMAGVSAAIGAATLVERFKPWLKCLAMCGVCAGNPSSVTLGDVIIANMTYQYDEGKVTIEGFQGAHEQITMPETWKRATRNLSAIGLTSHCKPTEEEAKHWLLQRLLSGDNPRTHIARKRYFQDETWKIQIDAIVMDGLVRRNGNEIILTSKGASYIQEFKFDHPAEPNQLPFEIKVGPMASGNAVRKEGIIWSQLEKSVRSILGIDMEAAAIATVAQKFELPYWMVVKGVMDHADTRKADSYKSFAARASAEVLFKFLLQRSTDIHSASQKEPDLATVQRTRDLDMLRTALSLINSHVLDDFIMQAPLIIPREIFYFWGHFNDFVKSSSFYFDDPILLDDFRRVHTAWNESLSYGSHYFPDLTDNCHFVSSNIRQLTDADHHAWEAVDNAVTELVNAWTSLLDYVRTAYPEVALVQLSQVALTAYLPYHNDIELN